MEKHIMTLSFDADVRTVLRPSGQPVVVTQDTAPADPLDLLKEPAVPVPRKRGKATDFDALLDAALGRR